MQRQNRYLRTFGEVKGQIGNSGLQLAKGLKRGLLGADHRHLQCYNCRFDLLGFEKMPYNSMLFHSILITFRVVCQALKLY